MHLTVKQRELLTVVARGSGPDEPLDLDQILETIRYETTKQSLQFSIRALIVHGFIVRAGIESRRGRQRQVIAATRLGRLMLGETLGCAEPHFVVSSEEAELELAIHNMNNDVVETN